MLSYFTPWPVHEDWYLDTVPPGHFTFSFDNRDLLLWYDSLVSEAVLRIDQPILSIGEGLQFSCYINNDGLTQFDATNVLKPFEEGMDVLIRYVLDTESWVAGPSLDYGSQVSILLADLMLKHRKDKPRRLTAGEIVAQPLDPGRAVVHVCVPEGMIRLLQVEDCNDPDTGDLKARRLFVYSAPSDGPDPRAHGGALVVDSSGARSYTPDVIEGRFDPPLTGDGVPVLFHDLAPRLWADGGPIDTLPEPQF